MMKTIRNFMGLALIITFAITFLFNMSCYEEPSNEVIIGGLFGITGDWPTLGKTSEAALEIAIEDINEEFKGNEKNVKFASSVKDTELEPELALESLIEFYHSGIKLVIGPMTSAEVSRIKPYVDRKNDIIIVSQSSTAGELGDVDNIFRFAPHDGLEGEAITALLLHDNIRSIIPIFRDDAGNRGVIEATKDAFEEALVATDTEPMDETLMGKVVEGIGYDPDTVARAVDALDDPDTTDFTNKVEELHTLVMGQIDDGSNGLDAKHIAVLLAGFDEVVQILKEANKMEYDDTLGAVRWYGTDGIVLSEALLKDEDAAEFAEDRTYLSPTLGLDDDMMDEWGPIAAEIEERTDISLPPDAFALSVYDIAWTLAQAYLNTAEDPEDPDYFEAFKVAFVLAAADTGGITGSTKLNEAGDRESANFAFWGIVREDEDEEDGTLIWEIVEFFDADAGEDGEGEIVDEMADMTN